MVNNYNRLGDRKLRQIYVEKAQQLNDTLAEYFPDGQYFGRPVITIDTDDKRKVPRTKESVIVRIIAIDKRFGAKAIADDDSWPGTIRHNALGAFARGVVA